MFEIIIKILKDWEEVSRRFSFIWEIVLTNFAKAFRHEIEKGVWNYIEAELVNEESWEVISGFEWTYEIEDFDHYLWKIESLCDQLEKLRSVD